MALLDGDRFEGKFRDGVHVCDTSDLIQKRLREEEISKRGQEALELSSRIIEDVNEFEEDTPSDEREAIEQEVVDQASAARTITELKVEISQLQKLEQLALGVRRSDRDRKWEELSQILQNQAELFDANSRPYGARRTAQIPRSFYPRSRCPSSHCY